ncbi:5-oxoprolinase subunit PxpA [Gracilibacillus marinus]|uniref:5-oxoprolinase subunit PxpA n=1 Tax=Gracilibacillus marinus TaxID=630535 RepID=A0ABV8VWA5_9BACI
MELNCDIGEDYGQYTFHNDEQLLPYVNAVNIACGFHAGDFQSIAKTVTLAKNHHVHIGAHPGYPDIQGFGRRAIHFSADEIYHMMLYQLGAIDAFVKVKGATLHHVKPHGALYNSASTNELVATAIVNAIYDYNPELLLYGLSGSVLATIGEEKGLVVKHEVFADRTYQANGTLTDRKETNALIEDEELALEQVKTMLYHQKVKTIKGHYIPIKADTICVHGDTQKAIVLIKKIHPLLQN